MDEVQINKIKKRADEYATSCFPYEKQFLEREAVVKCCVHVVTETIADLETQIEKMKCCGNCKHFDFNEPNYCHKGVYRERQYVCSKWEFGN